MLNSLDAATLNHFGLDRESSLEARRKAGLLFSRALSRGRWNRFWRRLLGRETGLRALGQVPAEARRRAAVASVVNVPLDNIVGSEGRVEDFDRDFSPLNSHNADRWTGIAAARRQGIPLPPVLLIQAGDGFYVRDGHHRVSVARAAGQAEIEAQIVFVLDLS